MVPPRPSKYFLYINKTKKRKKNKRHFQLRPARPLVWSAVVPQVHTAVAPLLPSFFRKKPIPPHSSSLEHASPAPPLPPPSPGPARAGGFIPPTGTRLGSPFVAGKESIPNNALLHRIDWLLGCFVPFPCWGEISLVSNRPLLRAPRIQASLPFLRRMLLQSIQFKYSIQSAPGLLDLLAWSLRGELVPLFRLLWGRRVVETPETAAWR